MTDPSIATSQHLLKRLEEEIKFLNSLMAQVLLVTSNLKELGHLLSTPKRTGKETLKTVKSLKI